MNPTTAIIDDFMFRQHADESDGATMDAGCHYDYVEQTWKDGHDHAHLTGYDSDSPLWFCGADFVTCQKGER